MLLYWSVGKRLREEVLGGERAEYGKAILKGLSERLTQRYGRGYTYLSLTRMVKFASLYPDHRIVARLAAQLTWTNVVEVLGINDQQKRDFYLTMCAHERWSKRTLRSKIGGKLHERTLAAGRDAAGLHEELARLAETGSITPALAFRDPYVLDFLDLPPKHSEADLERAILDEMQRFLLELGAGFAFIGRQKRIVVDGDDYHLDLLFYHVKMRCCVAIATSGPRTTRHRSDRSCAPTRVRSRWSCSGSTGAGYAPPST